MKICYIGDPISIHLQRWVKWFADRGHEVHVVTYHPYEFSNSNIHMHEVKMSWFDLNYLPYRSMWAQLRKFRRIIKEINPDIVHGHYISAYGLHTVFAGNYPKVLSAWGSDILIGPNKSKITEWIVKFSMKSADLITCDAEHMKEAMIKLGANSQKIYIIYFGTDTKKFNPKQRSEKLRKELGVLNSPVIISLRTLEPMYDVKSLITSIPMVLKESREAKFVIAGRGSQEPKLRELAKSLGVYDSIRFVGFIPNDKLPKYLASSDIYISTSLSDAGLAASTGEAMACEIPVITTDVGANRQWVEDGVNGFIIPTKDPGSLAEKIILLLRNKDLRIKFGKISKKIVEERLDYYREMERMEKLYEKLVDRYRRG